MTLMPWSNAARMVDIDSGFVGAAPHPTADGPGADRDARHFQRRTGNVGKFHIDFESFSLMGHDLLLL